MEKMLLLVFSIIDVFFWEIHSGNVQMKKNQLGSNQHMSMVRFLGLGMPKSLSTDSQAHVSNLDFQPVSWAL